MLWSEVGAAIGGQPPGVDGGGRRSFANRGGLLLQSAHLYLIYWGGGWLRDPSPSSAEVTAAVSTTLASGYTNGLAQYGAERPILAGELVVSSSDPPIGFADSDIAGMIFEQIEGGTIPEPATDPSLVYVVFLPAGIRSIRSDVAGEHSYFTYLDLDNGPADSGLPPANAHYGWVSNDGSLDQVTTVFSHELVETITDPEGNGITGAEGTCPSDGWCEIGDVCSRSEVLAGVRVQSYWSQEEGACVVPSGETRSPQVTSLGSGSEPAPNGSGGAAATTTVSQTPVPTEPATVTPVTVISTQKPSLAPLSRPSPAGGQRAAPWWNELAGALVAAAPVIPMVAVVATVIAYLLPLDRLAGTSPPLSVLLSSVLATLAVWLILGAAGRPLATARFGNIEEYSQLRIRADQLRARLAGAAAELPSAPDDARGVARGEALQLQSELDRALVGAGLAWVDGMAYIMAWTALHRAEEALFLLESLESVIGQGLYDELRLEGSEIANVNELLSKVRRAVSLLSAQAGHLYLGKEDLASAVDKPPAEKADPELAARTTLRTVRLTLNQYRDELWSGIVRARNKLLKTHFIAALGTYLLLILLVLRQVDRRVVFAASVFFLFGGLVGFVGRLRDEASTDKGLEDFGLGTARLLTAPLLSGLAAILGVLLVGLAHLKIGDLALGPAPASGSSFPSLTEIFNLGANPAGFVAAALFGLTPALLIGYLQAQTSKLNQAIKSSEASGAAPP